MKRRTRYFKTTSPQGDGNQSRARPIGSARISKPHPRKGTETFSDGLSLVVVHYKFQNHIPARGRKLPFDGKETTLESELFQNHIPARGRKPLELDPCSLGLNFKTTSPQGDGNLSLDAPRMSKILHYFKTTSPQGDGNARMPYFSSIFALFQNHIPARGRKREALASPVADLSKKQVRRTKLIGKQVVWENVPRTQA